MVQSFKSFFQQFSHNIQGNFAKLNTTMQSQKSDIKSDLISILDTKLDRHTESVKDEITQMQSQFHQLMDNVETRFEDKLQSQFTSSSKRARINSPPTGISTQDTVTCSDNNFNYGDISQTLFPSPTTTPPASPARHMVDTNDIAMRK